MKTLLSTLGVVLVAAVTFVGGGVVATHNKIVYRAVGGCPCGPCCNCYGTCGCVDKCGKCTCTNCPCNHCCDVNRDWCGTSSVLPKPLPVPPKN